MRPLHSTCRFTISPSRDLSSLHPSVYPSSSPGNMRASLRATALCAALRPAGPALCQCQISTHVWSSSDTSSIYPSTPCFSPSPCFFLSFSFSVSPSSSHLVVFFSSAVFSSKSRLPPLHRPGLIFHFQITVAHSCFPARSLFLQCTERQTQQRRAETQWAC